ncbi:uncharacterized protein [Aegilops tauschii subsp. strangulata]|uniref:uncharacterized protein n=1 Tax=Aegilops tauschii subsp. strangulata TaxID=200361 RepID=UPI00098ADDD6|nr:uncharacterized protein LOC109747014 [Aegilops tauschii subsp. strangulata]
MHFNGSKMCLGLGASIVLSSPKGDRLWYVLQIHFASSNNVAEYKALVHGLWLAKELENEAIDTLAKIASSRQSVPSGVSLEHLHKPSVRPSRDSEAIFVPEILAAPQPAINLVPVVLDPAAAVPDPGAVAYGSEAAAPEPALVAVFTIVMAPPWALPISEFLENGVLPMDETKARQVQRWASAYNIINNELVKRNSTGVFQRCVEQDKGIEILLDIHQDTKLLVLKCEGCQRFSKRSHEPASALWTIPIA